MCARVGPAQRRGCAGSRSARRLHARLLHVELDRIAAQDLRSRGVLSPWLRAYARRDTRRPARKRGDRARRPRRIAVEIQIHLRDPAATPDRRDTATGNRPPVFHSVCSGRGDTIVTDFGAAASSAAAVFAVGAVQLATAVVSIAGGDSSARFAAATSSAPSYGAIGIVDLALLVHPAIGGPRPRPRLQRISIRSRRSRACIKDTPRSPIGGQDAAHSPPALCTLRRILLRPPARARVPARSEAVVHIELDRMRASCASA